MMLLHAYLLTFEDFENSWTRSGRIKHCRTAEPEYLRATSVACQSRDTTASGTYPVRPEKPE